MELSIEQKIIFDKYINKENIFITGPGGSGKSALIKIIYSHAINFGKNIQVCALTGCAAILLNCKAKTIHSWAGIGLGNGSFEYIIQKIQKNTFKKKVWKQIDILIIDEVSMLSLHLFELLNQIGQTIRKSNKPFGGIQIIFSGDFYQLPPIINKDKDDFNDLSISVQFCFESENWNTVFKKENQIQLIQIFRQTDQIYVNILNQIRQGIIKRKSVDLLLKYVGKTIDPLLITKPTKLFPIRNKVDFINNYEMSLLSNEEKIFESKYSLNNEITKEEQIIQSQYNQKEIQIELDFISNNIEKNIKLKIGAQVMCIINTECNGYQLCNGSQGIITRFCENTGLPFIKFNAGFEIKMNKHVWLSDNIPGVGISQLPLILAWALTIHKSQGATMDVAEIDVGNSIFECGQTYVALSRVKSLDGLYLTSFDVSKIKINKKVKDFYESLSF
jgi:ATP-dependent DNA helicase PIF1